MSGVLCSFVGASFGGRPEIGDAYEGGFFGGQINDSGTVYDLIVAPRSSGESTKQWRTAGIATSGTASTTNGPANTSAMISAGSSLHPAGNFCNGLSIGGFSDWYMPAKDELEVLYYNLKPTTESNFTSSGTNTNAVPSRGSNYTSGDPSQTSASDFTSGSTEAFEGDGRDSRYWASTQDSGTTSSRWQAFSNGEQEDDNPTSSYLVRAVRRVVAPS